MSPLQFSLFFAALLVAYVLVHLRLVRFERYLREISVLRSLNERLQAVSDVLKSVSVERLEERIDLLHDRVTEIGDIAARIEQKMATPAAASTAAPTPARRAGDVDPAERILARVESTLLAMGYRDLHILTDLSEHAHDSEIELVVECQKNQMPHKGKVTIANGSVRDVDLSSVARSFP